jgi:hypothetical protein
LDFVGELPVRRIVAPLASLLVGLDRALTAEEQAAGDRPPVRGAERRTVCIWVLARRDYIRAHARAVAAWLRAERKRE